ncbi:MAG: phosphohistidine phosphatase SixA [Ignavibacteria bacterium]|nr:phosphohistidine phosphatase SixA [Ignavibacteria bacterium]
MDLYVLRHAIAVPHGTEGYERDSDRPLTPRGARKMERIARGMKRLGVDIDVLLTSPFPRALQTAEIVHRVLKLKSDLVLTPHLAVGGDQEDLIREIMDNHSARGSVMICGHEPSLSELIAVLLSGKPDMHVTMKKGGLCRLSVSQLVYGRSAVLEWMLPPRVLTRVAR